MLHTLNALSPLDGRYHTTTKVLSQYTSEAALIRYRLMIEIEWLIFLSEQKNMTELPEFSASGKTILRNSVLHYSLQDAERVKNIEKTTKHDVKAIEYFLKEKLQNEQEILPYLEFIHFGCTSEDINNIAYALMLKECLHSALIPSLEQLLQQLSHMAQDYADIAMLARTHGQPATPTTLGKEFANVAQRLQRQMKQLKAVSITAKMNGATGNFNAHMLAYPTIDWLNLSRTFIEKMGLTCNVYTTQIEPHDYIAEYAHALCRINTILIDLSRDIWGYISLNYFTQSKTEGQIGSSTMPHKVNPIDFENAEGNLGLANALLSFFAEKLPISRWQRDLSDSTVLRNSGIAIGYSFLAYQTLHSGLNKLTVNTDTIANELDMHWEVLTEGIQTVLRKHGAIQPYETLKTLSQGKPMNQSSIKTFIETVDLPQSVKDTLLQLTPASYIGLAKSLAKNVSKEIL